MAILLVQKIGSFMQVPDQFLIGITRKFGKKYTIVSCFKSEVNIGDLAKKLKAKFACGGTAKNGQIELQGDHKVRVKQVLMEEGFPEETIEI